VSAYYNENDSKAAAWLRELIKGGHIAPGDVDERSIEDVEPMDVAGYTQCHFFAGIGGWSYALRLAGWSDERAVWTGSCPCQPFSAAGKGKGFADERHLWPAWFHLIRELRPNRIFGEQVANALPWLDLVSADLEKKAYAFGATVLGAHSVGAPHIRQRIYWVADRNGERFEERREHDGESQQQHSRSTAALGSDAGGRGSGRLANTDAERYDWDLPAVGAQQAQEHRDALVGNASSSGSGRNGGAILGAQGSDWRSLWSVPDESFITGPDGKRRPIKPGLEPLVNGLPGRVGLLRGYGNAIVPQDAAAFIEAYLDVDARRPNLRAGERS
jgi:DNA (cytosine-5)-methyltransferase 1